MNIHNAHLLQILSQDALDVLLQNGQRKFFPKNSLIVNEGDNSPCAFIINSGRVEILLCDEQGRQIVLSILQPGEHFGEMSLIDNEVRSAAVKALEDTELTVISKETFRKCLRSHPEIAEQIMLGLVIRLREANKKISSLALMDVHERVASMLNSHAKEINGRLVIEERLTHQQIANFVGASREMISRIMRKMAADGDIQLEGRHIVILKR